MRTLFIGTAAVRLSDENPARQYWRLEFTPSSVVAGNTGHVFVGRGFVPNGIIGDPNQGDVMNSGATIDEETLFPGDSSVFKGAVYAVADTAGQQCTYDEKNLPTAPAAA